MEVVAHLVNIDYQYVEEYSMNDGIVLKIKDIIMLPKDSVDDDVCLDINNGIIMNTHQAAKNKGLYQLALEIKDGNKFKCVCRVNQNYVSEMRYYKEKNIFFDTNVYRKTFNGHFELIKERSSPFDTAGTYEIDIFNGDTVVKTINVQVNPSSITFDDYLKMIEDLRNLREGLVINPKSKIGIFKKWSTRIEYIEEKLNEIEKTLKYIDKNPKESLKKSSALVRFDKIKKINSKVLREKHIHPNKEKFKTEILINSQDIYEHNAIKFSLLQIKDKLKNYKDNYSKYVQETSNELNNIANEYENVTNLNLHDKHEQLKAEIDKAFSLAEKIQIDEYNIFNTQESLIEVDLSITKRFFENSNLKSALLYGVEINELNNCFELSGSSNYIDGEYVLSLSNDLMNLKRFSYRDLYNGVIENIEKGPLKFDVLKSKKFSFKLETKNINEIIFLFEQLTDGNVGNLNIKAIVEKDTQSDYVFGGEDKGYYRKFDIRFVRILSVDDNHIPQYSKEKIKKFIQEYIMEKSSDEFNFLDSILIKEEKINSEKQTMINGKCIFNLVENKLKNIDKLSMFSDYDLKKRYPLKPTQVFINDSYYRMVYKQLKKLDDDIMFSFDKSNESILVNSTQNIYEIWCLFAILDVLTNDMGWELLNKDYVKDVMNSIFLECKQDILNKLKFELMYKYNDNVLMNIDIFYEPKIYYDGNKYKTPDYKIVIYFDKNTSEERSNIIYLDAKYRNYKVQGYEKTFINKDIKEVALIKYLGTFLFTPDEALVSMIVHSYNNDKYVEFSATKEKACTLRKNNKIEKIGPHRYGGFPLVPSNKKYLKLFFKMVFEYHLSLYKICWNCGSDMHVKVAEKKTKSGYTKYHCTCNSCNEFWVKTHCIKSDCNNDLVKHIVNYHKTDGDKPWNVVCPKCSSSLSNHNQAGI